MHELAMNPIRAGGDRAHRLAAVLADLLHVDRVSLDDHVFDDLGADSLVMAHFCARVRNQGDLGSVSMQDVYAHPSIRGLADALDEAGPLVAAPEVAEVVTPASNAQVALCGTLQMLAFVAYVYAGALTAVGVYTWIDASVGAIETYLRLVVGAFGGFLAVGGAPILAKWMLIGRFRSERIPLWSIAYVRFWIVRTLLRNNPVALLFVGTPMYAMYLRLLGAKVGRGAVVFSRHLPICTDLLTIGAETVIRGEVFFQCYRARANWIETGTVALGDDAYVGERCVLDVDTSIGNHAQLGHASALHSGQKVPDGERWHGSPAERTHVDYRRVPPVPGAAWHRLRYGVVSMVMLALVYLPLSVGGLYLVALLAPSLASLLEVGSTATFTWREVLADAAVLSFVGFFGAMLGRLLLVVTVPRVLNSFLEPGRVYPLFGFHDGVRRLIHSLTKAPTLLRLFGDSSAITHFLTAVGYRLRPVEQTGSNFGIELYQGNPLLCSAGTGTMASDGLAFVNDEVSSTSFRTFRVELAPRTFVGNDVTVPPGARTGADCLLATKAMVPIDGEIREGVGLLGSPCIEIPRTVERDDRLAHLRSGDALAHGLAAKNRYNLRTVGVFCATWWLAGFLVTWPELAVLNWGGPYTVLLVPAVLALGVPVLGAYFALVERCLTAVRPLRPVTCSIYDPQFWLHERLWKVTAIECLFPFDGTPFKGAFWRLMGVPCGRRVYDDGVYISERSMTTIGDDCVLNAGTKIYCHTEEEAAFKSDRTELGAGCTIGVGAFINYGITVGDGSELLADSFLMKGEQVPARARWGGNPAREMAS